MNILANWRTSLAGVILIAVAVLHAFFNVNVPGFTPDLGTAIAGGIGLIVATDAAGK